MQRDMDREVPVKQNLNTIAVQCRDVQKSFGQGNAVNHALASVTLDIFAGEMLMLVGPSGCGKTTLLSVIAGILNHDSGDIHLFGQNLQRLATMLKPASAATMSALLFSSLIFCHSLRLLKMRQFHCWCSAGPGARPWIEPVIFSTKWD